MVSLTNGIEESLRRRVCSVCVEALPDGTCGRPPDHPCPLFARLDEVVDVVRTTSGDSIEPYARRLRVVVCETCEMDENGLCSQRDGLECPLDMYFPLVVEVIESELARSCG